MEKGSEEVIFEEAMHVRRSCLVSMVEREEAERGGERRGGEGQRRKGNQVPKSGKGFAGWKKAKKAGVPSPLGTYVRFAF